MVISFSILMLMGNAFSCYSMALQESLPIKELSCSHHAIIGVGMGTVDALVTTPFYYFKNMQQLRQKAHIEKRTLPCMSKNPLQWYRGTGANAAGNITLAQCQNPIFEIMKKNNASPWLAAATSGALTALIACPADLMLRHVQSSPNEMQQKIKRSPYHVINHLYKQYGWRCFTQGLGVTVVRDAGFTAGYLAAIPRCREIIEKRGQNKLANNIAIIGSGFGIGLFTTVATHPFDTIAGELQNDPAKTRYTCNSQVVKAIYQERGLPGFFSGVQPRTFVVTLSILALDKAKQLLSDKFKEKIRQ